MWNLLYLQPSVSSFRKDEQPGDLCCKRERERRIERKTMTRRTNDIESNHHHAAVGGGSTTITPTKSSTGGGGFEYVISAAPPREDDIVSVLTMETPSPLHHKRGSGRGGNARATPMKKRVTRYVKKKLFHNNNNNHKIDNSAKGGGSDSVASSSSHGIQKKQSQAYQEKVHDPSPNTLAYPPRPVSNGHNEQTPLIYHSTNQITTTNNKATTNLKSNKYPHAKKYQKREDDNHHYDHSSGSASYGYDTLLSSSKNVTVDTEDSDPMALFLDSSSSSASTSLRNNFSCVDDDNIKPNQKKNKAQQKHHQRRSRRLGIIIENSIETMQYWHWALFVTVCLVVSAILFHSFVVVHDDGQDVETWSIIDTFYFVVVTFTTVGGGGRGGGFESAEDRGDSSMTSSTSFMVATCGYAVMGICCFGIALGMVGSNIIDQQHRAKVKAEEVLQNDILTTVGGESGMSDSSRHLQKSIKDGAVSSTNDKNRMIFHVTVLFTLFCGFAVMIAYESQWTWRQTLYYVITTSCTVGYSGNSALQPNSEIAKLIAIVFVPLAVISFAIHFVIGHIANKIMEVRSNKYLRRRRKHPASLEEDLKKLMDVPDESGDNNDRIVSHSEYLEYMLIAMNKVHPELLIELRNQYTIAVQQESASLTRNELKRRTRQVVHSAASERRS